VQNTAVVAWAQTTGDRALESAGKVVPPYDLLSSRVLNVGNQATVIACSLALLAFTAEGVATPDRVRAATHATPPSLAARLIPFGAKRRAEMVAYARRHYGSFMRPTFRLIDPRVIVIHYTETATFSAAYNTFATDQPDAELHELPGTCAHYVIDRDGTIYQLVSVSIMCRHTVGLNWTAIGIEHVGFSDAQVLNDRRQIASSLRLVHWLRCRFGVRLANVIGHNESLTSPYHHEDVPALRSQTHSDFNHADMRIYRRLLSQAGGC
jgi:hypothetical protein